MKETKTFSFQVKAIDDAQGLIEAYGSVFDNTDMGDDIVRPGAFKRTIQNSKGRVQAGKAKFLAMMLWNHDAAMPIGGWSELKEDSHGLLCKGQIVLSTQSGKEAYELIKAGVIQEFSIGYEIMPGGSNYDSKTGNRNLTELRLWEVSPVTFAMNQEALLVGVKAKKDKPVGDKTKPQLKTLMEHYKEEQAEDLLEDWQDVFVCSLTCAVLDAFTIGDQPAQDIAEALDAFKELVLTKFVAQAIECNLSGYLEENTSTYSYNSAENTLHNGSDDGNSSYGYMSRSTRNQQHKAGRAISAANQSAIDDHVAGLHDLADKAMKAMKEHTKAVHTAADDLATILQGSEAAYGTDPGNPDGNQEGKSANSHSNGAALRTQPRSSKSTANEDEIPASFMDELQLLRLVK